jgi:murein DD-endopeptidase MepM/ murein hydrolase activator NlpD
VAILIGVVPGLAQDLQSELSQKQSELSEAKNKKGSLSSAIASYSARIEKLESQLVDLRGREAAAEEELKRDEAKLEELRGRVERSIKVLEQRLDDIYRSGEPDMVAVILDADGFDDLLERVDYLDRIRSQDEAIVTRVRELKQQMKAQVERVRKVRDEIAAARAQAEAANAQLVTARQGKQQVLAGVNQDVKRLEGDVSDISAQIQEQLSSLGAGPIRNAGGGWIWPVNGPVVSPFGMRWGRMHEGIDIAAGTGTPIRAAKGGQIVLASVYGGYGNYTCISHGGGVSSCYAHQTGFARTSGFVRQGQVIGYVGCTGHCFGPHLHFEIRVNGVPQDPLAYL